MATTLVRVALIAGLTFNPLGAAAGPDLVDVGPVFIPDFAEGFLNATGAAGEAGATGTGAAPAGSAAQAQADADAAAATAAATAAAVGQSISPAATERITSQLTIGIDFCASLSAREYQIDCLSERFAAVAAALPATGDYAPVKAAIAKAARDLGAVAAKRPSRTLPTGTARASTTRSTPLATTRPLRPVRSEDLAQSLAEAAAIIDETQTVLLRSTTNSAARMVAYQSVAAVIGSSKVLLRSA